MTLRASALDKIAEFRRLHYPDSVLWKACNYLGANTGEGMWITIRDALRVLPNGPKAGPPQTSLKAHPTTPPLNLSHVSNMAHPSPPLAQECTRSLPMGPTYPVRQISLLRSPLVALAGLTSPCFSVQGYPYLLRSSRTCTLTAVTWWGLPLLASEETASSNSHLEAVERGSSSLLFDERALTGCLFFFLCPSLGVRVFSPVCPSERCVVG